MFQKHRVSIWTKLGPNTRQQYCDTPHSCHSDTSPPDACPKRSTPSLQGGGGGGRGFLPKTGE